MILPEDLQCTNNAGLLPKKGISATEIAKGCRRMTGYINKNRSLTERISNRWNIYEIK